MQKYEDVEHQDVKIYCNTNHFPILPFCGPPKQTHGARGLVNHYHMWFDTKLGHVTCAIHLNPCECT